MPFPALKDAEERLDAKRKEMAAIFEEAGEDMDLAKVKSLPAGVVKGDSRGIAAHIRKLNDEQTEIGKEVEDLRRVKDAADRARMAPDTRGHTEPGTGQGGQGDPGGYWPGRPPQQTKSFGELFTASKAFKEKSGKSGPEATLDIELKTLMTTAAGWAPEFLRTGKVVDFATRPIQVTDLIPQTTTSQAAVQYMEETTFTNAAAEAAEGGTYAEAALALTERSVVVRKIAVFLPVTDEQMDDIPQIQGYIDNRLPFMVRQRLDGQILVGNGTPPNLTGILNTAGIQTQAKGTDPSPDAIYKAIVKAQVTGRAMPDGVVYHPTNWQDIRLLRTADGIYIWGNPSDTGPDRIWGLPVAKSDAITLGTALVGDYRNFSELSVRRGVDVQVSNSHGTFFVEGKQALRADMRAALVVYRPAAFCTVTGL